MRIALLTPALGSNNVGDHFIELAIRRMLGEEHTYTRHSTRVPLGEADLAAINEADRALLCGTNLYQYRWASALDPDTMARIRVPVIPFGVGGSAGRLSETEVSGETRAAIAALHAGCQLGSVRDPHAYRVVERAGVENAVLTGCPVLHWAQRPELPPIEPKPRSRVVITARNWLMHKEPHNVDHPVQVKLLRRLIDSLGDHELTYAVHENFDARLVDVLGVPRDCVFESDSPQDFVDLYSNPDNVVVAGRLHAGMLALANGAPVLFIGHDTRTYSFCEMLAIPYAELFSRRTPRRAVRHLRDLLSGDVSSLAAAHESFPRLRAEMRRFLAANGLPLGEERIASTAGDVFHGAARG